MRRRVLLALLGAAAFFVPTLASSPDLWVVSTVRTDGNVKSVNRATGKVYYHIYGQGACTDRYSIRSINLDGTGDTDLTCGDYAVDSHYGMPRLSPDGLWMLALRNDPTLSGSTECDNLNERQPGLGNCNDLVIIKISDGTLTVLVEGTNQPGTAERFSYPQWSPLGDRILWVQYSSTAASIRIAKIDLSGTPVLSGEEAYAPADADGFYEVWGCTDPICTWIFISCLCEVADDANDLDVALVNTITGVMVRCTDTNSRTEEHGIVDPFLDRLIYSDNFGGGLFEWELVMAPENDCSQAQQLTHFNDPTHPQFLPSASGYVTPANPEWVTETSLLVSVTVDWTYPSSGSIRLMQLGGVSSSFNVGGSIGARVRVSP